MALAIATNTGALMAAASATSVNKDMETSMERLSTGKRINSAKDDAAGVAIASRLSSEIRGTNQAIRNAQDGQALINTAEGAHKEVENILQRMRELAVQAANDTNDNTDRSNLQAEFKALTTEIDRIAGATTWAGQDLLTGAGGGNSNGSFNLQVGGNTGAVDTITVTVGAMTTAALGNSATDATDAVAAVLTADFSLVDFTKVGADVTVTIDGTALTVAAADATSLDDIVSSLNANADNTDFTFSASGTDLIATANTAGASASTFTVAGGEAAAVAQVQTVAVTNVTLTSTDTIELTVGSVELSHKLVANETLADLIAGLEADTDFAGADFTIALNSAGDGIEITQKTAGAVASPETVTLSNGTQANDLTGTLLTAGADAEDQLAEVTGATAVLTADFSGITFADVDADITVTIGSTALTVAVADASSLDKIVTSLNANADNTDFTFSASGTDLIATAKTAGASESTFTVAGGGTANTSTSATPATATIAESGTLTDGDVYELVLDDGAGNTLTITPAAVGTGPTAGDGLKAIQDAFDALPDKKGFTLASNEFSRADGVNFSIALGSGGSSNTGTVSIGTTAVSTTAQNTTDGVEAAITVAETTAGVDAAGVTVAETTAGADAEAATTNFDISNRSAALLAVDLMDAAISTVNTQRAELGAISNRLDNTVSNLTNISINLEGGKGRIEDADFAAESTSLAKSQILQQASTAMLAQANASKQSVLSLLQG